MRLKSVKLTDEEELMLNGIRASGGDAYKNTLKKGVDVSVVEGKKIYRVRPDGKKIVIGQLNTENMKKTTALKFRVK